MMFVRYCSATLIAAALLCSTAYASDEAYEDWNAKFQMTLNWQHHPKFNSPYSGANSLTSDADNMYTYSVTGHFGFRPWRNGEVYYNPEFTAGVPFGGSLVGNGSYTNGEITRAGGETIKYYRQRLFYRHTWNNGGGVEQLGSEANQMACVVDKNRVVLTAGNFSILDVFDDNTYAKDPRTQFMNWGSWTYAAYDYAADARGFGWGFAVEWYLDDWVFRLGRITGPVRPNELEVDFQIGKHYGDQIEIERAHTLFERPGKSRLLVWRNKANMSRFSDAQSYLQANPTANSDPSPLFNTRNDEQYKWGVGINLEQEISNNAGVFLRAMHSDGQTETYAFTEVDDSIAVGALIQGAAWGREGDTIGVAFLKNTISAARRDYLAAGGMSYFLGDGALNYQPELVFEAFYGWKFAKGLWLTGDYQRIANPAYNADRGPVNVYAIRIHAEF